jgi:hypothetical protein
LGVVYILRTKRALSAPPIGVSGRDRPIRGKGRSVSKGDLKEPGAERRVVQQLPVTDSTPYVFAPIPEGFPDLIPVLDSLGSFLFFADETLARQLVAKHQVRIVRRKKKHETRALQALGQFLPG